MGYDEFKTNPKSEAMNNLNRDNPILNLMLKNSQNAGDES
jgi:hypothetical protein